MEIKKGSKVKTKDGRIQGTVMSIHIRKDGVWVNVRDQFDRKAVVHWSNLELEEETINE